MSTSNTSYTCDIPIEPEQEINIEFLPKIIKNIILYFILIGIIYVNYLLILNKYNYNNFTLSNKYFNIYIFLSITILFTIISFIYLFLFKKLEVYKQIYILFWVLTIFWIFAIIFFIFFTNKFLNIDIHNNFKLLIFLNLIIIYFLIILKLNKKIKSEYEAKLFLNNLFNNYELLIILNFIFYIFYNIVIIIK